MMDLYLIRHALADEQGPKYPDDSKRPLISKGHKQAQTLAKFLATDKTQFDQLFSSPYTRAAQTAEALSTLLKKGSHIHYLDELTLANYQNLIGKVKDYVGPKQKTLAMVGHEPFLSEFCSYLLTGSSSLLSSNFKKACLVHLQGSLEPATMSLSSFIPYASYKHLVS